MFNSEASLIEELEGRKEEDSVSGKFQRLDFPSYFLVHFLVRTIFSLSLPLFSFNARHLIIKGA